MFSFVPWFVNFHIKIYIDVLERDYKLVSREIQSTIFPRHSAFTIIEKDHVLRFSAFTKLHKEDILNITIQYMNGLFEKQNYTNLFLTVLEEQIVFLQNSVERIYFKLLHLEEIQKEEKLDLMKTRDESEKHHFCFFVYSTSSCN